MGFISVTLQDSKRLRLRQLRAYHGNHNFNEIAPFALSMHAAFSKKHFFQKKNERKLKVFDIAAICNFSC